MCDERGGKAKGPDKVMGCDMTTNKWRGGKSLAGKVADMLVARQLNVGTFGQHPPVMATQNQSRHSIFVSGIADIHLICIQVPELHTQNSSVRFVRNI
jgi:hypothetical protein